MSANIKYITERTIKVWAAMPFDQFCKEMNTSSAEGTVLNEGAVSIYDSYRRDPQGTWNELRNTSQINS